MFRRRLRWLRAEVYLSDVVVLPRVRTVLRRGAGNVIEGKLLPLAVFLTFLEFAGNSAAIAAALAWSLACVAFRLVRRERVPGLLLFGTMGLAVRSVLAFASQSMVVYFLQPTISTALVGVALGCSVLFGQPLAERLARDFFPFEGEATSHHPHLREFFRKLTILWSVTSMINASITLWLLLTQSTATFVLVKSMLGPATTAITITLGVLWFRFTLRSRGLTLVLASAPKAADLVREIE